ncbi:coumaroyl-CoA:anthocyanidin 3-O-glucoside-6''-O-coumaroyltransferase 1-like [Aristolochia californica]|uniref:coumaroyl-CoA:anthocyanidin 3-O-glucoside-6''-O-coumaroyltransferase 1-like n=1 Tax=Aristolochia californica TaxID=171875 RepID=UPI0035D691FE
MKNLRASMKVLQKVRISPPAGSVPATTLPLSFFDVCWLPMPPVQYLLFYELPISAREFQLKQFPTLAQALSLSLQFFYPLAGNLTRSPESEDHVIAYDDENGVRFTLAQSEGDFSHLVADGPRDVTLFHHLVPRLITPETEGEKKKPLLALQLTIFPGSGICMGITLHHVVADGSSTFHFMKSWASIFMAGGGDVLVVKRVPLVRPRSAKQIPGGIGETSSHRPACSLLLPSLSRRNSETERPSVVEHAGDGPQPVQIHGRLRVRLVLSRPIARRRSRSRRMEESPFLLGSRLPRAPEPAGSCSLLRKLHPTRLRPVDRYRTPSSDRTGHRIGGYPERRPRLDDGVLKDAANWTTRCFAFASPGSDTLTVAGSPKLQIYETDFGWGPPRKVEIVSIESTGAMSLLERRDNEDGLEIGLVGT